MMTTAPALDELSLKRNPLEPKDKHIYFSNINEKHKRNNSNQEQQEKNNYTN